MLRGRSFEMVRRTVTIQGNTYPLLARWMNGRRWYTLTVRRSDAFVWRIRRLLTVLCQSRIHIIIRLVGQGLSLCYTFRRYVAMRHHHYHHVGVFSAQCVIALASLYLSQVTEFSRLWYLKIFTYFNSLFALPTWTRLIRVGGANKL